MAESPRTVDGVGLEELKSLLVQALEDNARLKAENAELRDEIARLKGLNGRPKIKPSGMEQATGPTAKGPRRKGRRGSRRAKLTIDETRDIKVENVPEGARFKGYEEFVVQDLIIKPVTVVYRRERWQLPDGTSVVAALPAGTTTHFGPELKRFVLAQYHQGQTTIPRLHDLLQNLGIVISKRQLGRLLIDKHGAFLAEARDVLRSGLGAAAWISVVAKHASGMTTPAPATRPRLASAPRSATTSSPPSSPRARKAGSISSSCSPPATRHTSSTTQPSPTCRSTACQGR